MAKVADHKAKNRMDLGNVATVFGPNLLRPRTQTPDVMMKDSGNVQMLILTLIENRNQILFTVCNITPYYAR
jgi:hypothetical protein